MSAVFWKTGYQPKVAADTAYKELNRIKEADGGKILPERVVEESTPEDAPLHGAFEWDDATAAHEYRLDQARGIIQSIVVRVEDAPKEMEPQRVFVHVVEGGERHYRDTITVMHNPDLRKQVVGRALSELRQFRARYGNLKELAEHGESLDAMERALAG